MAIINLTPHDIVVQRPNGEMVTFPASGQVARVELPAPRPVDAKPDGIPTVMQFTTGGSVTGLPENANDDDWFIVSAMVGQALVGTMASGRCISPDTGSTAIRNEKGHIVAVKGWVQWA